MSTPTKGVHEPLPAGVVARGPAPLGAVGTTSHGAILDLVRHRGPITRKDLLALTGLSRTTLVERLETLKQLHLLREGERGRSENGRPPIMLEFDDRSRFALALDIGAAHAMVCLTDLSAHRLAVQRLPVDLTADADQVTAGLVEVAKRELRHRPRRAELLGVGISFPGLPGPVPGTIEAPAVLRHWDGFPLGDILQQSFGVPVILTNDAHAMAYGEYLADGRRRTIIVVKLSTGIGAGLVIDGQLHPGDSRGAGQFGHMRVPGLNALCTCGQRGCLATVASGRALLKRLQPHGVAELEGIVAAIDDGNAEAEAALREAGEAVGTVLAGVATMLDPGAILLGGRLGRLDPFVGAVRQQVEQLTYARTAQAITVDRTVLGEESAVAGLGALVVDTLLGPAAVDRMVSAR